MSMPPSGELQYAKRRKEVLVSFVRTRGRARRRLLQQRLKPRPSQYILDTADERDCKQRKGIRPLSFCNLAWCPTSARKCDVLPSAIPRHLAQVGKPPRQQSLAATALGTATRAAVGGRTTPSIPGIRSLHQWRASTSSRPPPSAASASATSPPELLVPLSFSSKCTQSPATSPSGAGLTGCVCCCRFSPMAATTFEMRGASFVRVYRFILNLSHCCASHR